ncbi:MAG: response regulator transcription factor [Sphingomicrobium sp.]
MRTPLDAAPLVAIVDDDDLIRVSLASLFRSFGVRAEAFSSAASFLSVDPDHFDIVVSDLHMPGMSGIELKRILSGREVPTPVIIITAYPERASDWSRSDEGLLLLEKPVDGAQLITCIEKVLGRTIS